MRSKHFFFFILSFASISLCTPRNILVQEQVTFITSHLKFLYSFTIILFSTKGDCKT